MTNLNPQALEAAKEAYKFRCGDYPFEHAFRDAVRAYLSALPVVDDKDALIKELKEALKLLGGHKERIVEHLYGKDCLICGTNHRKIDEHIDQALESAEKMGC